MDFVLIIVLFVVVVALYLLYKYFANQPLTTGLVKLDGNSSTTTPYDKLENPGAGTFYYEMWLFISSGSPIIFYRGSAATPDMQLKIDNGVLKIQAYNGTTSTDTIMALNRFPYQKWMYVVINVVNKKTVELYINGKLVQTVQTVFDIRTTKTSSLTVGVGPAENSYVTRFFRKPKILSADDVWGNYLKGNGVSSAASNLIKYNMNVSITKGDELVRELKLIPT